MDFLNISRKLTKMGLKNAFYVDVNVFSLSKLTILNADIPKTSSEPYRFLSFLYVGHQNTLACKKKRIYREVNYVHLVLSKELSEHILMDEL